MRPRFSLRSFLIGINLLVLVLPVAGIQLMRLYESALVRQTESALIAQAAFIAAFYRSLIAAESGVNVAAMSREVPEHPFQWRAGRWVPQPPTLDLATSPVLPPLPDPEPTTERANPAHSLGARLNPMLKDAQLTTLAGIRVVDAWGTIIATTGEDLGLSLRHGDEIAAALDGVPTSQIRYKSDVTAASAADTLSRTGNIRVFVASPIMLDERLVGAVMLSRTPPNIVQALYAKRWLLLQAMVLLVAIVVVMSLLSHRLISRPIARLAALAETVAAGRTETVAALASEREPRTVEIARLQRAITNMATTLEERATHLRDFSRHVSHEFKTPIASIRGAIEVLQDHRAGMSDAQFDRFVANITADTERLQRLTERLNELTQAELEPRALEVCAIKPLLEEAAATFPELTVNVEAGTEDVSAEIDREAVVAALEVLLENAAQNGATAVGFAVPHRDPVTIRVSDNGRGITEANAARIFDPFFTTARENGGTGLGLPIARAMLERGGGRLALVSRAAPTAFELSLGRGDGTTGA